MAERRETKGAILSDGQIEYLQTGDTTDPDTYLSWGHGRDDGEARRFFEAARADFPPGFFPWAERNFGGER
jgi:hypothetical protein